MGPRRCCPRCCGEQWFDRLRIRPGEGRTCGDKNGTVAAGCSASREAASSNWSGIADDGAAGRKFEDSESQDAADAEGRIGAWPAAVEDNN